MTASPRGARTEPDDSLAQVVVADDPRGGQAVGRLERLDGRHASRRRRCRRRADDDPVRPQQALDRPDVGPAVAEALVREARAVTAAAPGAVRREQQQGEGDRHEAAERRGHGRTA